MANILVAEDEPDIMTLVGNRLTRAGHTLLRATDGLDALSQAIEHRPELVVLDWMMPGLTGLEVCAAIRSHPAINGTRVIMLTALAQESDLAAAYAAGVDDYIIKPFRPRELQERVAALLARA